MRSLLDEIRAIRRAYYLDHTPIGDVLDVAAAAFCVAGILGQAANLIMLLERHHG
jgi:hypothetical protein